MILIDSWEHIGAQIQVTAVFVNQVYYHDKTKKKKKKKKIA